MKKYVGYSLIIVALLTLIVWAVSHFIQPILPQKLNSGMVLFFAALLGTLGSLASFKDVLELFRSLAKSSDKTDTYLPTNNKGVVNTGIAGSIQVIQGDSTNITLSEGIAQHQIESLMTAFNDALTKLENQYSNIQAQKTAEFEREKEKIKKTFRHELASGLISLAYQFVSVQAGLSILQNLLISGDLKNTSDNLSKILAPLTVSKEENLGFSSKDKFRFAIYKFYKSENILKVIFEDSNSLTDKNNDVLLTDKYASIALKCQCTIISPDIRLTTESEIIAAVHETPLSWESSIMVTPIFGADGEPIGAFTISSNRKGHLTQEYKICLESFAILFAILLTRELA